MSFPKTARYKKVMKRVHDFLLNENITNFPLDPFSIINRNKWGLMSYSEFAREEGVTIEEVTSAVQSEDGFTIYDGSNYTILYNDTIESSGRIRFTLMHEIGHIYLNHLTEFDETILKRSALTEEKYRVLENEANSFARNTLAPAVLVKELNITTERELMEYFHLSQSAAKVRLQSLALDIKNLTRTFFLLQKGVFKEFINNVSCLKRCVNCNYSFFDKYIIFCPICGNKNTVKGKREETMIYSGYVLDQNGRPSSCPVCDNEEVSEGDFCKVCGVYLINECTNFNCNIPVEGNARYCKLCGHPTTYFNNKILKDWKTEKEEELLPF